MISSVPVQFVHKVGGFWGQYQNQISTQGLDHQYQQLEATSRFENFRRVTNGESGNHEGYRFNDSDVYKWLEAAAYSLCIRPSKELLEKVHAAIAIVSEAQAEDGYIFTYVQLNKPDWKWANLTHMHEMYCIGHLIEAAVALKQCLDIDSLLDVALKAVECIMATFGPQKRIGSCGHPEIELALYRLFELTGKKQYAELADWMIDSRGQRPSPFEKEFETPETNIDVNLNIACEWKAGKYDGSYLQDDKPIREQDTIVGHSVRAAYLYAATQASASRRKDAELQTALDRIWDNLIQKRMYITGGIGSTGDGEGFTSDYDLPNLNAYAETCAGVALAMWARRAFLAKAEADPLEILERTIFNGVLSGISLDTTAYFYDNVLEARGDKARASWFGCACCPPNIARLIASITNYALFRDEKTLYIAFPIDCEFTLENGLHIRIETDYPHSGKAKIFVEAKRPTRMKIAIRLPDWADEVATDLPNAQPAEYENGFAVFDEVWEQTRGLSIEFEMQPRVMTAHPSVLENVGRVAIQYGPSVYCAEVEQSGDAPQHQILDLDDEIPLGSQRSVSGAPTLVVPTLRQKQDQMDLYEVASEPTFIAGELTLFPYRDWANGPASYMQVWLRT